MLRHRFILFMIRLNVIQHCPVAVLRLDYLFYWTGRSWLVGTLGRPDLMG